jgi:Tfp pilus assembly PilM family ATPase
VKRQHGIYVDIGHSSLKVLHEERGLEIPLGRQPGGELTEESREALRRGLRGFLGPGRSPLRALCAVPAQGISLRFLSIPPASRDETARILSLLLEKEFPLPADQLSWGYLLEGGGSNGSASNGNGGAHPQPRMVMVAAVRRQVLADYSRILADCGLRPSFSPGMLAAGSLCPRVAGRSSVLDLGRTHSELLNLEDGRPSSLRSLSWGSQAIDWEISNSLAVEPPDAEGIKISYHAAGEEAPPDPRMRSVEQAIREGLQPLLKMLRECWASEREGPPRRVFVLGGGSRSSGVVRELAAGLGGTVSIEPLALEDGPGRSAAILGLRQSDRAEDAGDALVLDYREQAGGPRQALGSASVRRWAAAAVLLLAASLALRYGGPYLRAHGLEDKLARVRQSFQAIPRVDRELAFLSDLKASRTPFLEVLAVIASSAPRGGRISSVTLNRKGDVTLQGNLGSFQEINEFRAKLIGSRWFTQVVLQDQTPTKDQSRMDFHITAQLKRGVSGEWPALDLPPAAPEPAPGDDRPAGDEVVDTPPPPPDASPPAAPAGPSAPGTPPGAPAVSAEAAPAAPPGGAITHSSKSRKIRPATLGVEAASRATEADAAAAQAASQDMQAKLQALSSEAVDVLIQNGGEVQILTPEGK